MAVKKRSVQQYEQEAVAADPTLRRTRHHTRQGGTLALHSRFPRPDTRFSVPSQGDFALAYALAKQVLQPCPQMDDQASAKPTTLLNCLRALGMASYAVACQSQQAAAQARIYYLRTIQALNSRLACDSVAREDFTLLIVVAVSYFESILGLDEQAMVAWSNHINGTAQLLKLRGLDQMQTADGRILFMQATTCLISSCLKEKLRLPSYVREVAVGIVPWLDETSVMIWNGHSTMMDVTDFYSDVCAGRLSDPYSIIQTALSFDARLADIYREAPVEWQYEVLDRTETPLSGVVEYAAVLHVYGTSMGAQLHNAMRTGRIICQAVILGTFDRLAAAGVPSSPHVQAMKAGAVSTITQCSMHVLATVPQFLGRLTEQTVKARPGFADSNPGSPTKTARVSILDYEQATLPIVRTSSGYQLVWAVALVAKMAQAGSTLALAACAALKDIGSSLGIQQALHISQALEAGAS